MDKQNLIIFKHNSFYNVMKELEEHLNFKIFKAPNEKILNKIKDDLKNYLVITSKKINNINNQFILDQPPTKLNKLIERFNVQFLKINFLENSKLNVGKYKIDLNSRKLVLKDKILKLTEKEINTIIYLSKAQNPVTPTELQKNVWGYQPDLETHTVETHIYRLRKKFSDSFDDKNFITSIKNGYKIK